MQAYSGQFTRAADGIREVGTFGEPEQWQFDWERSCTRDEWLDVVPTSGDALQQAYGSAGTSAASARWQTQPQSPYSQKYQHV